MPAALLARFGRATAEQVVQHVDERHRASGAFYWWLGGPLTHSAF